MSFEVYLVDKKGEPVQVETHAEGATIKIDKPFAVDNMIMGGTSDAEMSITYNYNKYYRETLHPDGLRYLDGMKAKKAIPMLRKAIKQLGTKPHYDYWTATPGNAGNALATLLTWAEQYPNATFVVH